MSLAGKLGLLEEEPHSSRTMMLQQLTRFLLRQMTLNYGLMVQNSQPYATDTPRPGVLEEVNTIVLWGARNLAD